MQYEHRKILHLTSLFGLYISKRVKHSKSQFLTLSGHVSGYIIWTSIGHDFGLYN